MNRPHKLNVKCSNCDMPSDDRDIHCGVKLKSYVDDKGKRLYYLVCVTCGTIPSGSRTSKAQAIRDWKRQYSILEHKAAIAFWRSKA